MVNANCRRASIDGVHGQAASRAGDRSQRTIADRDGLVGRREAHRVVRVERHERVGLRIVGGAAAVGERVGHEPEAAHDALDAVGRDA